MTHQHDDNCDHDEVLSIAQESRSWPYREWETFRLCAGPDHVVVDFMRPAGDEFRGTCIPYPRVDWAEMELVPDEENFTCRIGVPGGGSTVHLYTAEMLETFVREFTVEMT